MTYKEKAFELVEKYMKFEFETPFVDTQRKYAKQCALIAVDEIIKFMSDDPYYKDYKFFEQVKTEIEAL
jgi:hypothetical protein